MKTLSFGLCESSNGLFSSIKGGEYLSDYQLVKEDGESRGELTCVAVVTHRNSAGEPESTCRLAGTM